MELIIKQVKLFKFQDRHRGEQVSIYVEPLTDRSGRLIISTQRKIFQRYFDGVSGGIYDFLTKAGVQSIPYVFDCSDDDHAYLLRYLLPVWGHFLESISDQPTTKQQSVPQYIQNKLF